MQDNPLLAEKYRVQRDLARRARGNMREYLRLVEQDARGLFQEHGWTLRYAERRGGRLEASSEPPTQSFRVAESGAGYGTASAEAEIARKTR